jgi:hypothetical protein
MKLSVLNSTPERSRVSSLTSTNEAVKFFHYKNTHKKGKRRRVTSASRLAERVSRSKISMNQVYTINQGGN